MNANFTSVFPAVGPADVLHFADAGGADAVVELQEHAHGGDDARVDGGAAPGATGDAHDLLVFGSGRKPAAGHLEAALVHSGEGIHGILGVNDDEVTRADGTGPDAFDGLGRLDHAVERPGIGPG